MWQCRLKTLAQVTIKVKVMIYVQQFKFKCLSFRVCECCGCMWRNRHIFYILFSKVKKSSIYKMAFKHLKMNIIKWNWKIFQYNAQNNDGHNLYLTSPPQKKKIHCWTNILHTSVTRCNKGFAYLSFTCLLRLLLMESTLQIKTNIFFPVIYL